VFRIYTETASFGVSIEPKQAEDQPKQTETNRNEVNGPKLDKIGEDKMNIKEACVPTEEDRAYSKANHLRNLLNYQNGAVINQLTYVGWGVGGGR
jgi:hypothetical protein